MQQPLRTYHVVEEILEVSFFYKDDFVSKIVHMKFFMSRAPNYQGQEMGSSGADSNHITAKTLLTFTYLK